MNGYRIEMPNILAEYSASIARGDIVKDPAQEKALKLLNQLAQDLTAKQEVRGFWPILGKARQSDSFIPGLYIYGGVGRGKSMLMDMFFDCIALKAKKRVHFHEFMAEIHQRLHILRHTKPRPIDPVEKLVEEIAMEARLLCFDEFHVTNIADAMILTRLFSALWKKKITMIATSNWAPDDLYLNGLQRDRFLPFIALLKKHVKIIRLDNGHDYRIDGIKEADFYFLNSDSRSESRIKNIWSVLSGGRQPYPASLLVNGRQLTFSRTYDGLLWVDFSEICATPLGAIDYLAMMKKFNIIILENLPLLTAEKREETKRFMTFVDIAYEARARLFVTAYAEPEMLLADDFYAQEFARSVSRLNEMRRSSYAVENKKSNLIL